MPSCILPVRAPRPSPHTESLLGRLLSRHHPEPTEFFSAVPTSATIHRILQCCADITHSPLSSLVLCRHNSQPTAFFSTVPTSPTTQSSSLLCRHRLQCTEFFSAVPTCIIHTSSGLSRRRMLTCSRSCPSTALTVAFSFRAMFMDIIHQPLCSPAEKCLLATLTDHPPPIVFWIKQMENVYMQN